MKHYDVAIALRVYPGISKQPIGNFCSKLEMFRVNLLSLYRALGSKKARIHLMLDGCNESFAEAAGKIVPPEDLEITFTPSVGNEQTFLLQIDWLLQQGWSENLFFAEDDYVYQAGSFEAILNLLEKPENNIGFVSPHNHGDYYRSRLQQKLGTRLLFSEGHHWHLPASTCLTFFTRKEVLQATQKVFRTYARGNLDFTLFTVLTMPEKMRLPSLSLLKERFFLKCLLKAWWMTGSQLLSGRSWQLAVPVEAAGTHLQFDETGPGIDWEGLIDKYRRELT